MFSLMVSVVLFLLLDTSMYLCIKQQAQVLSFVAACYSLYYISILFFLYKCQQIWDKSTLAIHTKEASGNLFQKALQDCCIHILNLPAAFSIVSFFSQSLNLLINTKKTENELQLQKHLAIRMLYSHLRAYSAMFLAIFLV